MYLKLSDCTIYKVQGVLALRDFCVLANSCKMNLAYRESVIKKLLQNSLNADFKIDIGTIFKAHVK